MKKTTQTCINEKELKEQLKALTDFKEAMAMIETAKYEKDVRDTLQKISASASICEACKQ